MNHMKTAIVVLLILVSLPVMAMDLLDTYRLAQHHDPAWRATLNTYLAEQQNEAIAAAGLLPNVSAFAAINRSRFDPDVSPQTFLSTDRQYSIAVRQPVFSPERWARYQQAKVATHLNDARLRADQQAFVLKVAEAYFNVLQAEAELASLRAEEHAFDRQHVMMQARFKAGVLAKNDVTEALAQYQSAVANRISAEISITTRREELTAILGQPVEQLAALRQDLPYEAPYPSQIADWEALAKQHNPNIAVARLRAAVADQNRKIQAAGHQPRLDLIASASENTQDLPQQSFNDGRRLSVGFELSIPLYSGGQTTGLVRQAAYQVDAAKDQIVATERQAIAQVRSAFLNLQADQARIAARQAAVASGQVVAEASQVGYELGVRNIVEVLLAQRGAFAARRDYIAARYAYVINILRLRAAAGQLTAADLAEINTWLK